MTHLTQLQFSMFADGALADDDLKLVEQHLDGCADCRTQLDTNTNENQLIKAAMLFDDGVIVQVAPVPKFSKRISLREFAIVNLLTGLSIWLVQFLWKSLFGELISELAFNAFTWVTLIPVPDLFGLILGFAQYFTQEGTTMIYAYIGFVVATLLVAILTWFAFSNRKTRSLMSFGLGITLVGSLLIPSPADALEFRRGDTVTIESNETVDDTLLVGGDTVVVDGHVTGDLIVVGERVVMNGTVDGNLVIMGESVSVQGQVGGFLLAAGASVGVAGATIGGDLWSAGEGVNVDKATQVGRNAAVAGEKIFMAGDVKKDFYAAGQRIELEDGVLVEFEDADYRTGDYWLIPARVASGDIEWPGDSADPDARPPHGVQQVYAPLAYIAVDAGGTITPASLRHEIQL